MIYLKTYGDYLVESDSYKAPPIHQVPIKDHNGNILHIYNNPIWPNLFDADLRNLNLQNANLYKQNLKYVIFSGSNLSGANLSFTQSENSKFITATVKNANFEYGEFTDANFNNAILDGSNFSNANLNYAQLENASLKGVDFNKCIMWKANLRNADLSNSKGLETISDGALAFERTGVYAIDLRGANLTGVSDNFFKLVAEAEKLYLSENDDDPVTLAEFFDGTKGLPDYEAYKPVRLRNRAKKMFGV